ncbi:MAG: FxLYD domain-containing protein [Anaerolineae bacterium]|nr:FxLYD domain-containing protein [Anaerolineae bacterium]
MLPVIQYGWLFLLICVGIVLLVAGCATFNARTSTRSAPDSPLVTLTVVPFTTEAPQPHSTLPTTITQLFLPPPRWLATRTPSSEIQADDPTCYHSPNRGYTCLGQVHNQGFETLSNVTVQISLFDNNGQILAEQTIGLEQRYIPPETSAPYHARFEQVNSAYARAEIQSAQIVDIPQQLIRITSERGILSASGRYVVTANLLNSSENRAEQIRLITTLLDAADRVVGYRIQSLSLSQPRQSVPCEWKLSHR